MFGKFYKRNKTLPNRPNRTLLSEFMNPEYYITFFEPTDQCEHTDTILQNNIYGSWSCSTYGMGYINKDEKESINFLFNCDDITTIMKEYDILYPDNPYYWKGQIIMFYKGTTPFKYFLSKRNYKNDIEKNKKQLAIIAELQSRVAVLETSFNK